MDNNRNSNLLVLLGTQLLRFSTTTNELLAIDG